MKENDADQFPVMRNDDMAGIMMPLFILTARDEQFKEGGILCPADCYGFSLIGSLLLCTSVLKWQDSFLYSETDLQCISARRVGCNTTLAALGSGCHPLRWCDIRLSEHSIELYEGIVGISLR